MPTYASPPPRNPPPPLRRRDTRYIPLPVALPLPLSSPSTTTLTTHTRPGPSHAVRITTVPERAASSAAVRVSADDKSSSTRGTGRKYSEASVYSVHDGERGCEARVRNVSEVPDLYYSQGEESSSEGEFESWFNEENSDDEEEKDRGGEQISPGTMVAPRKEKKKDKEKDKPIEVGWAYLKDGGDGDDMAEGEVKGNEERKGSHATVFPRFSYVIPTLPPKKSKSGKHKQKAGNDHPASPRAAVPPSKSKTDLHALYKSAKQIYAAGPRGEAYTVIEGVQEMLEKKRLKKLEQERERVVAIEEAKKHRLEQQLADMHAAAQEYQAELRAARNAIMKETAHRSPAPKLPSARPAPAEPLGVRRKVSLDQRSPSEDEGRERTSGEKRKMGEKRRNGSEISDYTSLSIPIAASASVQYDATKVVLDRPAKPPLVPRLDPGPRSGGEESVLGKRRVEGPKKKGLPPPPSPPRVRPSHSHTRSQRLGGLDEPSVQRTQHEKRHQEKKPDRDWLANALGAFFNVSTASPEPPANHAAPRKQEVFNAAASRARKQAELKASISQPYAPSCPGGVTANFAKESGGVGGPAAAISLPPGITRKSQLDKYNNERKSKGKGKHHAKRPSPLPPTLQPGPAPPPLPPKISVPEPHRLGVEAKREQGGLLDLFSKLEGGGKYFHGFRKSDQSLGGNRKRADSDDSFVCQGIDDAERREVARLEATRQAQPRGVSSSRVQPSRAQSSVRGLGPSRQRAPRKYVSDENVVMIPPALFTGELRGNVRTVRELPGVNVRDTGFYALYDDVLSEYGN